MQSRIETTPADKHFHKTTQENLAFSNLVTDLIEKKFNKKIDDIQKNERKPKADKGV